MLEVSGNSLVTFCIKCVCILYSGELRPGSVFLARAPRLRTHTVRGFVVSVIIT